MTPDEIPIPFAVKLAALVAAAVVIVVIVAVSSCDAAAEHRAAVHDVERALGAATLMTYAQAATAGKGGKPSSSPPEGGNSEEECCAICLSEYAKGDELVRVVPACGHFFHANCDVDWWLRTHRTCPICRGGLWPLPRPPRPECPPMPPRAGGARMTSPQ